MTVAERIKARREELGIRVYDFIQAAGITKSYLYRLSSDPDAIPIGKLEAIARVLQTTPDWLLGKTDRVDIPPTGSDNHPSMPSYHPSTRIPILGRISAGLPLYAEENIEGYIYADFNDNKEYFALKVSGDSMTAARINDGDTLIVRRADIVDNGTIAVVLVGDDEATVKRFYKRGNTVTLMPQSNNPIHQPQVYNIKKTKVRVQGQVVQVQFPAQ